jgi:hypothetical protein
MRCGFNSRLSGECRLASFQQTQTYQAGQPAPSPYTLELFTMLDNAGKGISYGSPQNFGFVYFEDFGSANGGSVALYY